MRHRPPSAPLPRCGIALLCCAIACLLAACGSGRKDAPTPDHAAAAGATTTTGSAATKTSTSRSTATSSTLSPATSATLTATTTATVTSTRTSASPAFAQQESGQKALAAAIATVKSHGYTPDDTSEYHPSQTLRVLTGIRTGSADGHDQRAFFFVDDRYVGTDASAPSAAVKIVSQGESTVTLGYGMYRPHDPMCCPSGGEATVRFELDNGRLLALSAIPPAHSSSGPARL